jgi:hypothetical protein
MTPGPAKAQSVEAHAPWRGLSTVTHKWWGQSKEERRELGPKGESWCLVPGDK